MGMEQPEFKQSLNEYISSWRVMIFPKLYGSKDLNPHIQTSFVW